MKKYTNPVHALPVLAALLAAVYFVPRTSKNRDANANANATPNANPRPSVREAPSTAEEGLINWATDRGAKVRLNSEFNISRQTLP